MREPTAEWILVVENDDVVRDLTSEILQSGGHEVRTAHGGSEALAVLDYVRRAPECVILDYSMPGMDGIETLTHLRGSYGDLPVLLISGQLKSDVEDRFTTIRPDDFLEKPFGANELLSRVDALL